MMKRKNWIPLAILGVGLGLFHGLVAIPLAAQENQDLSSNKPVQVRLFSVAKEQDQEVDLLDRDGRKIKGRLSLVLRSQDDPEKFIVVQPGGGRDRQKAKMVDNQVVVQNEDGSESVVQAESWSMIQSQRTMIENGEEKTEVIRQMIVTDPQGRQYEVELSGDEQVFPELTSSQPPILRRPLAFSQAAPEKFMIGVQLEPVAESLAAQLNLEPATGLMVNQITPDSPAAQAGLRVYDILLYVDHFQLRSVDDMAGKIQTAGQAGESINLVLIRGGKEEAIEVKPIERSSDRTLLRGVLGDQVQGLGPIDADNFSRFNVRQAGPGLILEGEESEIDVLMERMRDFELSAQQRAKQTRKTVEELPDMQVFRQQTQKMVEEMRQRAQEIENQSQNHAQEMMELMRNMRVELEELRKLRKRDDQ